MRKMFLASLLMLLVLGLAACKQEQPPVSDPAVLGDAGAMPKQLATIGVTATATPVVMGEQTVNIAQPTATPAPPRATPTMTPYVGYFMGESAGEEAPTLAPYVINPIAGGAISSSGVVVPGPSSSPGSCSIPVAAAFANAYSGNPTLQQQLGCPVNGGMSAQMVTQPFERGQMYWRDTRQIYVLAASGQFWQIADSWQEGMPADDPSFAAPGGLLQPVRGFGLAWRSNQAVRDALGWGTLPEAPYSGVWQDFERGAIFVGANNQIYAVFPAEGRHSGPLPP